MKLKPSTRAIFPPQAETTNRGHGRIEHRAIHLRSELADYSKFPHLRTTFRLDRSVTNLDGSNPRYETVYGLTSHVGTSERAATKLLALVRGHWKVESNHWIRDVTFDEDRSQIRKGNGPQVMATLRNLAVSIIGLAGGVTIAKTTRWLSRRAEVCFRLIGYPAPQ